MRYGPSLSSDYMPNTVVVRDFESVPPGRVLCVVARDNKYEAEQVAVMICDSLNNRTNQNELGTI
jgi:hypothetical protein